MVHFYNKAPEAIRLPQFFGSPDVILHLPWKVQAKENNPTVT